MKMKQLVHEFSFQIISIGGPYVISLGMVDIKVFLYLKIFKQASLGAKKAWRANCHIRRTEDGQTIKSA